MASSCSLHSVHRPSARTIEHHHVIPVAWQQFWQPPSPWPYEGMDPNGRGHLWDARVVLLAPTCHRNVHYWIVEFMHRGMGEGGKEREVARWAMERFLAVGGDLIALCTRGLWGEA